MMIVRFFSLKLYLYNNNNKYRVPVYSRKIKKYKKLMIVRFFFFSTRVVCTCRLYSIHILFLIFYPNVVFFSVLLLLLDVF